VSLLNPIAEAVACAHARGVAHCDIKPGNIVLLGESGSTGPRCKLFDFGIAKVMRAPRSKRPLVIERSFTPAFGAPEQFDSMFGATGPWTDVYALALIVVELVSGREALCGDDVSKLACQSCDADRRPTPKELGVDIDDDLERVLARALALRPWDRFPDARSFWNEITTVAAEPRLPTEEASMTPGRAPLPADRRANLRANGLAAPAVAPAPLAEDTPPAFSRARAVSRRTGLSTYVAVALGLAVVLASGHSLFRRGAPQDRRASFSALAQSHTNGPARDFIVPTWPYWFGTTSARFPP